MTIQGVPWSPLIELAGMVAHVLNVANSDFPTTRQVEFKEANRAGIEAGQTLLIDVPMNFHLENGEFATRGRLMTTSRTRH
jgi:hypothetical protein